MTQRIAARRRKRLAVFPALLGCTLVGCAQETLALAGTDRCAEEEDETSVLQLTGPSRAPARLLPSSSSSSSSASSSTRGAEDQDPALAEVLDLVPTLPRREATAILGQDGELREAILRGELREAFAGISLGSSRNAEMTRQALIQRAARSAHSSNFASDAIRTLQAALSGKDKAAPLPAPEPTTMPLDVLIGGIPCVVKYPAADGGRQFPVAVVLHAEEQNSSAGYDRLHDTLNLAGFVVVANNADSVFPGFPNVSEGPKYPHTIISNLATAGLSSAAELRSVSLVGHSQGCQLAVDYVGSYLSRRRPELKAIVCLHGFSMSTSSLAKVELPAFFLAGGRDRTGWSSFTEATYLGYGADRKVFAKVTNAKNMQVMDEYPDDLWESMAVVTALLCYVKHNGTACDTLCNGLGVKMDLDKYLKTGCVRTMGPVFANPSDRRQVAVPRFTRPDFVRPADHPAEHPDIVQASERPEEHSAMSAPTTIWPWANHVTAVTFGTESRDSGDTSH